MTTPPAISQIATPRTAGIAIASLVLGILAVTCLSILAGIPALILGIIALNKVGKSGGALTGKGFGIAGIVMGGVSFLLLPITAALLIPIFAGVGGARDKALEAACLNNVKQITMACYQFDADEGKLPQTLDELVAKKFIPASVLTCPLHRGTNTRDYELLNAGKKLGTISDTSTSILIRETKANHHGKRTIGYADGHVAMEPTR
jgi:prepilin-type processing-associated H-X9-DG protein